MPDRTIIQWDKDDLDALGLLKVDCLALGMLTCDPQVLWICCANTAASDLTMATIPAEDPATYAMIQQADTRRRVPDRIARADGDAAATSSRENFYDLVVQVAIVRPGPIQGDMVHPYLRRRRGDEPVDYPSDDLRAVFERTLGVPLFQEQVMKLAIVAAGFTPGEADQLRRAMAAWKRRGGLEQHRERISRGMRERGYSAEFAAQLFDQIKGFGSYGFPESHAASFACIVYASCWLKCHEPAAFTCALLNAQPMGFYAASQIVQDARRHASRYARSTCSTAVGIARSRPSPVPRSVPRRSAWGCARCGDCARMSCSSWWRNAPRARSRTSMSCVPAADWTSGIGTPWPKQAP